MVFKLFLLFTVVPFVELALLIKVGTAIGVTETVMLIIITGVIGALMVRSAGVQCLFRMQQNLQSGAFPADELFTGLFILVAGAFLITPGLITDVSGFLLLYPPAREVLKARLKKYLKAKIQRGDFDSNIDIRF